MVHGISGDKSEDENLLDKEDAVEDGNTQNAQSTEDASAELMVSINDQEGLALTGGDWFKTIKNAAATIVETEKELAERMEKAEISQMSQANLDNEVFGGGPPFHSSADAAPPCCKKNWCHCRFPPPPPAPPWNPKKC